MKRDCNEESRAARERIMWKVQQLKKPASYTEQFIIK